jgi:hypothetical protein
MKVIAVIGLVGGALSFVSGSAGAANTLDLDAQAQCPSVYRPVCASKGRETKSFGNACLAEREGFSVVGPGKCGGSGGLPRFCTKEYAPVCGEKDGSERSFGNACEANAADFAVVRDGNC